MVAGISDEYLDLPHYLLYVRAMGKTDPQIEDSDTATNTLVGQVGPVYNFLQSLFSKVDVALNRQPVSPPNSHYAFRVYLETLLNYGPAAKHSHLGFVLGYDDTAGKMDHMSENNGLAKRKGYLKADKI